MERWNSAHTSFGRSEFKARIRIPHIRRYNHYQRLRWYVCGCNWWACCRAWWRICRMTPTLMFIVDSTLLALLKETFLYVQIIAFFNNCGTYLYLKFMYSQSLNIKNEAWWVVENQIYNFEFFRWYPKSPKWYPKKHDRDKPRDFCHSIQYGANGSGRSPNNVYW